MRKKIFSVLLAGVAGISLLTGCGGQATEQLKDETGKKDEIVEEKTPQTESGKELFKFDDVFTKRDLEQVADLDAAIYVELSDSGISIDGRGASAEGSTVTFTDEGIYVLSGSLSHGQLVVDAGKEDKVQLVFQGVSVTNDTSAALYVKQADKVFVTTGAGTDNSLQTTGEFVAVDENNVDGTVFAKDDIVFSGEGSLKVVCEADHGIVGKDDIKITGGNIAVDAQGDGLQAKDGIYLADGVIQVLNSEEGMEAQSIAVWGGNLMIIAEDDGLNAAGDSEEGEQNSFRGNNPFAADLSCNMAIYGGVINVSADGDGLDSNGNLYISGGEVYVNGPVNGGNGAIDYGGSGVITGGILAASGASGMAENMSADSTQCTMMVTLSNQMLEGEVKVTDDGGNVIFAFTPEKAFNNVVISHPDFEVGKSYTVSVGENSTTVTFESIIYGEGMMNGRPGGGFGGPGHGRGEFDGFEGAGKGDFEGRGERPEMGELPEGFEMPEGMKPPEGFEMPEGMEPPEGFEMPEGMERPEKPENL